MGKDWDRALPDKKIWQECLRVLKDGAFAFIMSIPRADCLSRMIISLEDAGFNIGFTPIFWAYASGFPKAQNIGKVIDKKGGVSISWFGQWLKKWRLENGISQKEIAKLFPSKTGGLTGCVANWELGLNMPTPKEFTIICQHFNLPFERIEEAKREIISRQAMTIGIGGNSPRMGSEKIIDIPATPQAKALDGSYGGFQPKPAIEVIIVAMKPLEMKTYVDQALKNRKGITWLDDGRIPYKNQDDKLEGQSARPSKTVDTIFPMGGYDRSERSQIIGRFPANLCCEDDVLNDGRDRPTGGHKGYTINPWTAGGRQGKSIPVPNPIKPSFGSFSRYFDLDKWFEERIKLLPQSVQMTFPFLLVSKASKSEKNKGCEDLPKRQSQDYGEGFNSEAMLRNFHPTVKPLKLMSYLITLGSREGDIVLDPFMGSGTTGIACKLLNREFIGCEINKEYFEIARKRI